MKEISLTRGQVALVDDEDFARFGRQKWHACYKPNEDVFYARRNIGVIGGGQTALYMHRHILGITDPRVKVDHWNHDTLDNRRSNLRACTNSQNMANRIGPRRGSPSAARGVYFFKNKWKAEITVRGKRFYLGFFSDKADAMCAYAAANRQHFGEFGGNF